MTEGHLDLIGSEYQMSEEGEHLELDLRSKPGS